MGTANHGPGENVPSPAPVQEAGKTMKSRNLDEQETKVSKRHFDKRMGELIDATRDLAQEQHTDNLKIEAGVGVSTQIGQDMMQFMTEFEEKVRISQKDLRDKMVLMEDRLRATEKSANDALALSVDVKSSINGMTEAVTKCDRQLAVYTRVGEKLEGFVRENQSPRVRQDSKRLKRTRDQSPAPEIVDLERESNAQTTARQTHAPMEQATPQNEGTHNVTRQSAPPPGTVLHNGSLATKVVGPNGNPILCMPGRNEGSQSAARQRAPPPGTILRNGSLATTVMGPNGTPILRTPGPRYPGPNVANSATQGAAPHDTIRTLRDGSQVATYTARDGTPILRLPRPIGQGPNQNGSTRPKQNSYATAAAATAAAIPGLNLNSQRAHHSLNTRGANQGPTEKKSGADKQPTRIRQDQFTICPNTGHVNRVEAYKTVPYKSDKQKGKENKRHMKNLEQVMKELVLFEIPTKNKNGDIMSKEQDRARITKFLRELKRYGYTFKNGDVVGSVRQWKNTRHPDSIPITITFRDEDTRFRVEEAALEGGLKGHRTQRAGDEEYDRIGYIRRSLTERERKELKIRRDKRNSPEGVAFAEIKK